MESTVARHYQSPSPTPLTRLSEPSTTPIGQLPATPAFLVKVKDIGNHFVLQVKGDWLAASGIRGGDLVIFKRQATAREGQTVVALANDAVVIKKHRSKNQASEDYRIEGILAGVIRTNLMSTENLLRFVQKIS